MVKNGSAKSSAKSSGKSSAATSAQHTPVMTRGYAKTRSGVEDDAHSGGRFSSRRSNSICSTDQFELLEKKLLKSLVQVITEKFEEFENRIYNRIDSVVAIANAAQAEVARLDSELEEVRAQLLDVRRDLQSVHQASRLTDAVLIGIPSLPGENPQQLLSDVSAKINHALSPYATAFRPKHSVHQRDNTRREVPLILKFSSIAEQREFLVKFKRSGPVKLSSINARFSADTNVAAFESLTRHNNKILKAALRFRRENRLYSVFTRRGQVFVRANQDDVPIKVNTMNCLENIIPGVNCTGAQTLD